MRTRTRSILQIGIILALILVNGLVRATAQTAGSPVYLDPSQPIEVRVDDLITQMTLEEKAPQLVNQARAIPRLQVPAYDWWSEALHGVANAGTATVFPEPIGLAATFDDPLIHEMAIVIGTEARAKHNQAVRAGRRGHYGRAGFLVAEHQYISRSALGTRAGNVRRRSVSHGAHGRGVCAGGCRGTIRNIFA